MTGTTHELAFNGGLLARGFWLYIWQISVSEREPLYYVGRTGDSSSLKAQSPFNRMGQHLGFKKASNALRRQLEGKGVIPENCTFRLIAHGPIMEEGTCEHEHRPRRDKIAAMEKALACAMVEAGYNVINRVNCNTTLDEVAFAHVLKAFSECFPRLSEKRAVGPGAI
jgi:hypothetical protein